MKYKFRRGASSGLWCCFLLPCCLLSFIIKYDPGIQFYLFAMCLCCTFSYLLKEYYFKSGPYHWRTYIFDSTLSLLFSLFMLLHFSYSISTSFILCILAMCYYSHIVRQLLINCPGSFTLGEVQIIGQSIVLFLVFCIFSLSTQYTFTFNAPAIKEPSESIICLQVLILGSFSLVHLLHMFPSLRQKVHFCATAIILALVMMYTWDVLLKKNIFMWLLSYCTQDPKRIFLMLFWLISTSASIMFVIVVNRKTSYNVSTITRKYFHFIIMTVFIPGVFYDIDLLRLASAIVFAIFIGLEMFRILNFPIIGPVIEDAFQVFLDEKDSGILILTHIYLLIGCSSSIWLSGHIVDTKGYHICLLSGIISVGFGDTAAAVGGTLFGKHHWKDSKKTYEGSICAFFMQLIPALIFLSLGHELSIFNVMLTIVTVILTSLLEARTTQVDNLVLPLFMFSLLSWIS